MPPQRRSRTVPGPILEREAELAAMDDALAAGREGSGGLVFVEAQAGLGKSALLAAAAHRGAETGMEVLSARATQLERGHSFGVVLQLFEARLARADPHERDDLLSGAAAAAKPLLEGRALGAASPDEQLFAMLHGLYWVTSNLAEGAPLVVVADDAHWTDESSLRFFLYLAQRLQDLPVVLFITARPAEPGAFGDLLRQLRSHAATRMLRPAPLSSAGVATLVSWRMPRAEPPFVAVCASVTGGNPFLLSELLADLELREIEPTAEHAERVGLMAPDSVLRAALVRLGRLPRGASELAQAVAVLSDDATLHNAAVLAGLERRAAGPVVDALVAAELLKPGTPLAFVHPLLRSAIYDQIPAADRGELHARAARLLAEAGASAQTVAAHLLSTLPLGDAWAVERLRRAAERSLAHGAVQSAVEYLRRALEEPPPPDVRADVLLELGRAESLGGRTDSIARLEEGLELIEDPLRRGKVLRELGWGLQKSGDMRGAVVAFERGLDVLAGLPRDDESAAAEVASLQIAHLGAALLEPSSAQRAQHTIAEMLRKPTTDLGPHERGLLSVLAMVRLFAGEAHEEVVSLSLEVWGNGRLLEQEGSNSQTVWHVIGCLSWADALDEAEEIVDATMEAAEREGSIVTLALGFYARSWPRFWKGDLAACVADAQAAISAWSAGEFAMYLPVASYWYALAQLELGEIDQAAAALEIPDAKERWGRTNMYGALLMARGVVSMARGRPAAAVELFEEAGSSVLGSVIANPAVAPWRAFLSSALLASGDREGARGAAREEVELARRFGAARPLGIALRAAGLAEGGETGIGMLEEAVKTLRRSPSKLELSRALIDLGASMRRANHPTAAREPLREGLEMADRFGAAVLGQQAREELLASGAKPRRREVSGAGSLTPSELRVAKLAASGMTNREIAQSLFVTIKAVQWHLRNAYRKLEISSRDELARQLG